MSRTEPTWMRSGRSWRPWVVMLVLGLLASCSRQHQDTDFLPTAPSVRGALVLVLSALSVPADGVSTVEIVAEIDPAADFRKVEFKTDKGEFLDPDSATDKLLRTTEADIDGRASARLKSETIAGTATITVSVKGPQDPADENSPEETKVSVTGTVEFSRLSPDTLTFTITGDSLAADGFSFLELVAKVDSSLPTEYRAIQFEATAPGIIRGGTVSGETSTRMVTADADGNARAELTSPATSPQVGLSDVTAKLVNFPDVLKTFVVEFKPIEAGFIELVASAESIPADGFSTLELLATIDPETPPDFRSIMFTSSIGTLIGAGTGGVVQADTNGEARVQLQSTKEIGPVEVKAALVSDPSVFAVKFVDFRAPDSGAIIQLSTASSSAPADGETRTTVTAQVTPELGQGQTVTFTTSLGSFGAGSSDTATATTNDGRATAEIKSGTIGTAALTAQVDSFVADASISFGRAYPDSIEVLAGAFELSVAAKTRQITVKLRRTPGEVTEGTVVRYEIVRESDGTAITDMTFRSITASNSSQESSAELVVEGSIFTGLAVVEVRVPGSGAPVGRDTIKIVP